METVLNSEQIKNVIFAELPKKVMKDTGIRRYILKITKEKYADKEKTEDRIDRVLDELKRDREIQEKKLAEQVLKWDKDREEDREIQEKKWAEQNLKWDKNREEDREIQEKKWAEQTLKWDKDRKNDRKDREDDRKKWDENHKKLEHSIAALDKKLESSIGSLGARWGMQSEAAFRDGLKAILEESFKVKVERYLDFDEQGVVFGRPDQVEMDVIIYNGMLILCELKSSISKSDLYAFWRKKQFYENKHQRQANRTIVISPMVDYKAADIAKELGIEVYGYSDEVPVEL